MGSQRDRIGGGNDHDIDILSQMVSDPIPAIDAHRTWAGLLFAKHQVVDDQGSIRHREQLAQADRTTTAQGRLVFHMFGALAEFEHSLIRERTQAGLAAARRLGRTGGRPPKLTGKDLEAVRALPANPDIGVTQIAHRLGVSPATLYRYIPAARTANSPA